MHVIFVEPAFPSNQRKFVAGLAAVGARVTGIGERPVGFLDDELKGWLHDYVQVHSVVHEESLLAAVQAIQAKGWVDRLEATVEAHIIPVARVREAAGIPGTSLCTAFLCRDKPAMKQALREAGVPCARSLGSDSVDEVIAFCTEVDYPVVVKPRAAAGAADTYRVEDERELRAALAAEHVGQGASVAVEEFVEGHEAFYDTLTLEGHVVHDFISHYDPNVLHAMRTRWISPQIAATNRMASSGYEEVKAMGARVIDVLGIETSATHMEWFFGPKGLKFSEIGCRPPGVGAWDLYSAGNELDLYREWAQLIVHGEPAARPSRRFAAGMVALRPDRDGTITGTEGAEQLREQLAEFLIDAHFPAPGTPTQPVEAGYMANAWVRLRHPDYDTLRQMLSTVGEQCQLRAE